MDATLACHSDGQGVMFILESGDRIVGTEGFGTAIAMVAPDGELVDVGRTDEDTFSGEVCDVLTLDEGCWDGHRRPMTPDEEAWFDEVLRCVEVLV
jgi:hypothetical protein